MAREKSLNIPNECYEELASLSKHFNQDAKEAVLSLLDIVSRQSARIKNTTKGYRMPLNLTTVVAHIFHNGLLAIDLFNNVLEDLEVKGLYVLEDLDYDLDERYLWFYYAALEGCNLRVDAFDIALRPGSATLGARSYIKAEEVDAKAQIKLRKLAQDPGELPIEFDELDGFHIEVDNEGEEFWTLMIDCTAESFSYLPSVDEISRFVERTFAKAGIEQKS